MLRKSKEHYMLSEAQNRIWYIEKLFKNNYVNNLPYIIKMTGKLDYQILNKSIQILTERHKLLKNIFGEENGIPFQRRVKEYIFNIDIIEMSDNFDFDEEKLTQYIKNEISKPFNLTEAPPIRFKLIKISDQKHFFIITIHHIIADGWSICILHRELIKIYNSLYGNSKINLPPIYQEYKDYIVEKQSVKNSNKYIETTEFWKNKLKDAQLMIELPYDKNWVKGEQFECGLYSFFIPERIREKVIHLCIKKNMTSFMYLLSCLYLFLFLHSYQMDISIIVPFAGRDNGRTENTVGPYFNILIFRHIFDINCSFSDLLEQVRDEVLEVYEYSDYSYQDIVKNCFPSLADNPGVLPIMLSVQNYQLSNIEMCDLKLDTYYSQYSNSPTALSFTFCTEGEKIMCSVEYNKNFFVDSTFHRMMDRFKYMLEYIIQHIDEPITGMEVMPLDEKKLVLGKWAKGKDVKINKNIIEMFFKQVKKNPDRISFINDSFKITYAQLYQQVMNMSNCLKKRGIGKGNIIGVMLPTSYEFLVAVIAILVCGGCYLPLDPELDKNRLIYMIEDSKPTVVISKSNNIFDKCFVMWDIDELMNYNSDISYSPLVYNSLDIPACIIYTSGSSGSPKGVVLEHRGISNLIQSFIGSYRVTENDRILPVSSVASSSFVGEIFPILCRGGALVLATKNILLDQKLFWQFVEKNNVTIVSTIPSMIMQYNKKNIQSSSIRVLLSGGEILTSSMIEDIGTNLHLYNGFGLTETSICNTYCEIEIQKYIRNDKIPIGKPIINNQVYILNYRNNPVPIGVTGEIYISGNGISKGYLNNPEMTKERYIEHPYEKGKVIFATGDLGKWTENGLVLYCGRRDNQIKIRGYRVEVEEIEIALEKHPKISECIVKYCNEDNILSAYLVVESDSDLSKDELQEWIYDILPFYMHPSRYYITQFIPILSNGKKDRKSKIKDIVEIKSLNIKNITGNLVSQKLFDIFVKLVKHTNFSIEDTFFDIGGHSLLLPKLQDEIDKEFEVNISLETLLRRTSIEYLMPIILKERELKEMKKQKPFQENSMKQNSYSKTKNKIDAYRKLQSRKGK